MNEDKFFEAAQGLAQSISPWMTHARAGMSDGAWKAASARMNAYLRGEAEESRESIVEEIITSPTNAFP